MFFERATVRVPDCRLDGDKAIGQPAGAGLPVFLGSLYTRRYRVVLSALKFMKNLPILYDNNFSLSSSIKNIVLSLIIKSHESSRRSFTSTYRDVTSFRFCLPPWDDKVTSKLKQTPRNRHREKNYVRKLIFSLEIIIFRFVLLERLVCAYYLQQQ